MAFVLARERVPVRAVVHAYPRVVRRHEELRVVPGHELQAGDFLPPGFRAAPVPDVQLGEVIEADAVHRVKVALPFVRPGHRARAVGGERRRGDHLADVDPVRDAMIRDVPKPQLTVQRAGEEVLVVDRVKVDRGDEVLMREYPQTLIHRHVPQPHGLVHGRRQQPVRVRPAQVQDVARVPGVLAQRLRLEDPLAGDLPLLSLAEAQPRAVAGAGAGGRALRDVVAVELPDPDHLVLPRGREILAVVRESHRPYRVLMRLDPLHEPELRVLLVYLTVHVHLDGAPGGLASETRVRGGGVRGRGLTARRRRGSYRRHRRVIRVLDVPGPAFLLRRARRVVAVAVDEAHAFLEPTLRVSAKLFLLLRLLRAVHRRLRGLGLPPRAATVAL
mmetsp:Transcript_15091/g.54378  ORF Transcript_15091/g.54378 Transcript_15091/m.54378 type:complete len:388 (-) Transcript_15091:355-1518(-)|eukprot:31323-Pelagococcus_subviridis.AAC.5